MMLTYGSVCSGIESVSLAWMPLGMRPAWFAEIDPFCCRLLEYRFPGVHNYGDITKLKHPESVDIMVGGTPCQSFSTSGRRQGLDDPRGNLTLEFLRLAGEIRPQWVVWENVPGILSIDGGRTFGAILGALAEFGYGFAYRVLDAQYFGVPQRRRRVFVVARLGDWRAAAAVLFEPQSLRHHAAHCHDVGAQTPGEPGEGIALRGFEFGIHTARWSYVAPTITCWPKTIGGRNLVGVTIAGVDLSAVIGGLDGSVSFVRHITPRECERLQGMPDDWTRIPVARYSERSITQARPEDYWEPCPEGGWWLMASDTTRYRAIGNAIAVPVIRWIGERIMQVEMDGSGSVPSMRSSTR